MLLWFFVYLSPVQLKPIKHVPVLIAGGIIVLVGLIQWWRFDFLEGLERTTYDMRALQALKHSPTVATNLGFVFMDDASIAFVRTNRLSYRIWPLLAPIGLRPAAGGTHGARRAGSRPRRHFR